MDSTDAPEMAQAPPCKGFVPATSCTSATNLVISGGAVECSLRYQPWLPPSQSPVLPQPSTLLNVDVIGKLAAHGETLKMGGSAMWTVVSDARVKDVVATFDLGCNELARLTPKIFRYNGLGGTKADGKLWAGLLAQEVPERLAGFMHKRAHVKLRPEDAELTEIFILDQSCLPFVCINALKEHDGKLKEHDGKLMEQVVAVQRLQVAVDELAKLSPGKCSSVATCSTGSGDDGRGDAKAHCRDTDARDTHFLSRLFLLTLGAHKAAMLLLLGLSSVMAYLAEFCWEKAMFVMLGAFCVVAIAFAHSLDVIGRTVPIVGVVVYRIVVTLTSSDEVLQSWWEDWMTNSAPYVTAMWAIGGLSVGFQPISHRFALFICSCPLAGGLLTAAAIAARTGGVRGLTTFVPIYSFTFPGAFAVARTIAYHICLPLWLDNRKGACWHRAATV